MDSEKTDLVVVGAGAAGLYSALVAAREGARVALISATPLAESASYWAQGGLAAALASNDSPELHLGDTVTAGRGTVRPSAARVLCEEAVARVADLESLGMRFDTDEGGNLVLGLEGGHSTRRVTHAGGSATGRRVLLALSAAVAASPTIDVYEGDRVTDITKQDGRGSGVALASGLVVSAGAIILTTGGAAALWSRTTNPPGSIGIGLLLAHRVGAALADLEMVQFHPTAVVGIKGIEGFLITEAVRGEGALLLDVDGDRFVSELAPRDEVALAIDSKLRETGALSVGLDMRTIDPARFPNVTASLRAAGLDPATELVPIAPAAHYMMGGIVTDLDGRTDVPGLYAVGECACTGLHGANRLASNSLTECFVFGHRAALRALEEQPNGGGERPPTDPLPTLTYETRQRMWQFAGLRRSATELEQLLDDPYPLARKVALSALARRESRGAHYRVEHPQPDPKLDLMHTVIRNESEPTFERWE